MTPKQSRFVSEYLKDLNATQAAIRAGYSAKHADVQGPRLLGNAGIKAAIAEKEQKTAKKLDITNENVLRRIAQEADGADEPRDRLKALELLGKHLKLFTDKVEHSGNTLIRVVDPYALPPDDKEGE